MVSVLARCQSRAHCDHELVVVMGGIFLIIFKFQIIRDVIDKALIVALITGMVTAIAWTCQEYLHLSLQPS
jgi:hypothetical protein